MAYGVPNVKYGQRAANFGFKDYAGLGIAGAFGIVSAVMADMRQSADASALFVINKWTANLTEMAGLGQVPLYAVVLGLMGLGAASVFYFQPITMRGAYAQGFGILAALMTMLPSDLGGALEAPTEFDDLLPPTEEVYLSTGQPKLAYADGSNFAFDFASLAQPVADAAKRSQIKESQSKKAKGYSVQIVLKFPNGLKQDMDAMIKAGTLRGRLHNVSTKRTYNLFRNGGAVIEDKGDEIYIYSTIPGTEADTVLWARIEAAGYAITEESFEAELGSKGVWTISMAPSGRPLFLQRFGKSYWF